MKIFVLFLTVLFSFKLLAQIGEANQDKAVMVLYVAPVKVSEEMNSSYSKSLSNTIRSELVKSKKYMLANPDIEDSIEKAKNFNESCLSVEECARREAKALEADLVLITEVTEIGGSCRLDMRLDSIYSREIIKSKSTRASCNISDLEEKVIYLVYLVMREESIKASGERDAYFTTNPSGAKVTVDGKFLGRTPLKTKIKTGQVKISLEIEKNIAFEPINVLEVVDQSNEVFNYSKNFALKNSYLIITVSPVGAEIIIDGKPVDNESSRFPVDSNVEHKVEVRMDKFKTKIIETPSLVEDETKEYKVTLEPLPCSVWIASSPSGAAIFINYNEIGETPFEKELSPGEHQFKIKKMNYEPQELAFYCSADEKIQRVVNLKRSRYTEEEQERIDRSRRWRLISYGGFLASAGLGYMAYKSFGDYNKIDKEYSSTKDPFQIEKLAKSRDEAKTSAMIYSASSAVGFGLSYLFYNWGKFPEDLMFKDTITFSMIKGETFLAWNYQW